MGDVVEFVVNTPHLSGEAICKECGHEWGAVSPVGTIDFECPECGTHKATMKYPVFPSDEVYECKCGCDIFSIMRTGIMCYRCGIIHSFNDAMN